MVKIVPGAERVLGNFVEPRVVVGCRAVWVLVQTHQRIGSKAVVGHNVHDDRNPASVAFVDEFFEFGRRAIEFVDRKAEVGVVAPAQVAFKFIDRHELNRIVPHEFEVIQLVDEVLEGLGFVKVAHQRLVDHKAI